MSQIYRFDCVQPPVLSKKTLYAELERRKMQRQAAILAVAGILVYLCLIVTAIGLYHVNVYLSIICVCYIFIAMWGGVAIAVVFIKKEEF